MREDSMSSIYSYDELQLQLIDDNKEFKYIFIIIIIIIS